MLGLSTLGVDVGSRSRDQHLSGSALTAAVTSSTRTGVNIIR